MNKNKQNESDSELTFEIDEDLFIELAYMAHEKDITVNELANQILTELIKKEENSD